MSFNYKMVLVVRDDLSLSPGKLAVQVSHAAVKCALLSKEDNEYFNRWDKEGQKKVVVTCEDLDHMNFLKKRAEKERLINIKIKDAGLTEVVSGTETCLGIGPGPNEKMDKITGKLPLY